MILSLLTLDLSSPGVRQSLQDAQDMHRSIMKAFDNSRQEEQVLYRMIRTSKQIQLYVQSKNMPAWDRIAQSGFRCEKTKDISALPVSFRKDQMLRFKLLGCPAVKKTGEGKNSRRVILKTEEEQLNWLARQGEKYGFRILESCIPGKAEKISGKKSSGAFILSGIPFEGVLQVTDPDMFRNAFEKGIGAEKAYGFGMLMLSKAL